MNRKRKPSESYAQYRANLRIEESFLKRRKLLYFSGNRIPAVRNPDKGSRIRYVPMKSKTT